MTFDAKRACPILLGLCLALAGAAAQVQDSYFPGMRTAKDCRMLGVSPRCLLDKLGADPAEAYARSNRDLIRLFVWDAWGQPTIVAALERSNGIGQARLYDLAGAGHDAVVPLTPAQWQKAQDAVRRYRGDALHPPPPPGRNAVCISADAEMQIVETAQNGHVERVRNGDAETPDGCFDPIEALGHAVAAVVLDAMPFCAALPAEGPYAQLTGCQILSGDRMVAAEAYNRAKVFEGGNCDYGEIASRLATVSVGIRLSTACGSDKLYAFTDVHGTADGEVEIRGVLRKERDVTDGNKHRLFIARAPFEQRWSRGADGRFYLGVWIVDRMGPETEQEP